MLMKDARGQDVGWSAIVIFTYGGELRFGIVCDVFGWECGDVLTRNGNGADTKIRCNSKQLMRIRDAQIPIEQVDTILALKRQLMEKST